jgi:cold shock CspA family protein
VPTGTVVRFDRRRGYGFIQPDDQGEDVFVHQNNIQMEGFRFLDVGERVQFEMEVGEKGMKAVGVALTEPRKPRPEGEDFGGDRGYDNQGGGYGNQGGYGDDRPAYRERREYRPREAAAPRGPAPVAATDDRTKRKLERLISILVEKGVIAPGEIDGVDQAAALAEAKV